MAEEHAPAAGLGALSDDDLDGVGLAQVVGVHPVPGREELVDEDRRVLALLRRHAAVPVVVDVPTSVAPRPSASFAGADQGAELMPAIVIRIFSSKGRPAARPRRHVRVAALPVALERVAGDAGAEEEQVVEVRHAPLGAEAADVVDAPRAPPAESRR